MTTNPEAIIVKCPKCGCEFPMPKNNHPDIVGCWQCKKSVRVKE